MCTELYVIKNKDKKILNHVILKLFIIKNRWKCMYNEYLKQISQHEYHNMKSICGIRCTHNVYHSINIINIKSILLTK